MLKATRDGFGEAIVKIAAKKPNLMVLSADVSESLRLDDFKKKFPAQYLEVGICEQNMVGVAAGLASLGKTVVITSFAAFNPGRNWEQIRVSLVRQNLDVKIVGSHAGLATGADGATHQALEDLALTTVLPQMKVLLPADYQEAQAATEAMIESFGPTYLRLSREPSEAIAQPGKFILGKARELKKGKDATIIATGLLVPLALQAASELQKFELEIGVLNFSTLKPLDHESLIKAASQTGALVIAQEALLGGGLDALVTTYLSQTQPVPIEILAVEDQFGQSGKADELFAHYQLTTTSLKEKVLQSLARKLPAKK